MADAKTFSVACKLPQGFDLGNGIVLKGANDDSAYASRDGLGVGYGITDNVDADMFTAWTQERDGNGTPRFKWFVPLARGLIFYEADAQKCRDRAREQSRDINSGWEPLDPNEPLPGEAIEPTEEMKKELEKVKATAEPPAPPTKG